MKKINKIIFLFLFYLAVVWRIIIWFEAGKELEFPFASIEAGTNFEKVIKIFDTCEYLSYRINDVNNEREMYLFSYHNFKSSARLIYFDNNKIVSNIYLEYINLNMIAVWAAIILLLIWIVTQIVLVFSGPINYLTWRRKYFKLPPQFDLKNMVAAFVFAFGMIYLLNRINVIQVVGLAHASEIITIFFAVLFCFYAFRNLLSKNKWERYLLTPISFFISCCFIIVALSP